MIKRAIIIGLILSLFCGCFPSRAISAYSYILYNPQTHEIVTQCNAYEKLSMASTTKIMTGLLLCKTENLSISVNITADMLKVEGTSIGLRTGDKISRISLLYGLLLESGNDAANAIAIHLSGSKYEFAQLMNKTAYEIGMKSTNFVTPSGLDDEKHYTTAYDMALLAAYAMSNKTFAQVVSTKNYKSQYNNGQKEVTYYNHNRLLSMYDGIEGIKTGFTKKSGRCLVSSCARDGLRLIAITLKAPDDWNDHKSLYNYGFEQYEKTTIQPKLQVNSVSVTGSDKVNIGIKTEPFDIWLQKDKTYNIEQRVSLPRFLYAPIKLGNSIGCVDYYLNGSLLTSRNIVAMQSCDVFETELDFLTQLGIWMKILLTI